MKLLAIGNSFSQDATTFLHQTAAAQGIDLTAVNLYIGGCSLETHWKNWEQDAADYELQINGQAQGRQVGIREMLAQGGWDFIVTQQASHDSGWMDTYEPFLGQLIGEWKKAAPKARLLLHETWAYEHGSNHGAFARYHRDQEEMYRRLRRCYTEMARRYGLALIPCGDVIQAVRSLHPFNVPGGGRSLCRDGFHMSLGYGRYLLACVWLKALCGVSVAQNPYTPESEEAVDPALLQIIRRQADGNAKISSFRQENEARKTY